MQFSELFDNFKESIQEQVAEDDSETHYNLGVAYYEMELFEDAMQEFEVAGGSDRFHGDAMYMLGNCCRSLDRLDEALEFYERALGAGGVNLERACAIRYEQALTLRTAGNDEKALALFEEIAKRDSSYRDVQEQVRDITGSGSASPDDPVEEDA